MTWLKRPNIFVHFLYRKRDFDAFDDFSDFVESISCVTSEFCQVRGSNPCRGAKHFDRLITLPLTSGTGQLSVVDCSGSDRE
jgi:hypothetical protein